MLVRDLEGSDPSPRPERVAALTECAHRFAGHDWTDKVFFWSSSEFIQVWQYSFFLSGCGSLVGSDAALPR